MKKIKVLSTGKILEVSNNEAHRLIDSGLAVLANIRNRMLRPEVGGKKGYKIK